MKKRLPYLILFTIFLLFSSNICAYAQDSVINGGVGISDIKNKIPSRDFEDGQLPDVMCLVFFNYNNGSEVQLSATKHNTPISEPEVPTKPGYIFDGWYKDSNLTEKYDFSTKVTNALTLWAKWEQFVFYSNGNITIQSKNDQTSIIALYKNNSFQTAFFAKEANVSESDFDEVKIFELSSSSPLTPLSKNNTIPKDQLLTLTR